MAIQLGDTFYWKDGGHLWVVISDPSAHAGVFVAVNLTRDVFLAGKECVLEKGDHKWVRETTYVCFGKAMKIGPKEEANLQKQIQAGTIKMHMPMDPKIIAKIVIAAKTSKALSLELLAYL